MGTKTLWTVADYMALDEPNGPRHELSQGELLVSPSPTHLHNEIELAIRWAVREYCRKRRAGSAVSQVDFLLEPDTIRRPDAAFVAASRWRPEFGAMVPIPIAPDIAFEVVSPSERPNVLRRTVRDYLRAGVAAVWLVDPQKFELRRFGASAPEGEMRAAIEDPELLPGFFLPAAELFTRPAA